MTEISHIETSVAVEEQPETETEKMESKLNEFSVTEEVGKASPKKIQGCAYHFGYLSQRSQKEKIPEDCITCENIVQCMLKAVTG